MTRNIHEHMPVPTPEHQSIFTDTYHGVPSPVIPHEHPYPTRYHGPIYTIPRFYLPYRQQSWQEPQNLPTVPRPGAPCAGKACSGIGDDQLLMGRVTDSGVMDFAVGLAVGYIAAPGGKDRAFWAAAGGVGVNVLGKVGLIALVGAALYMRTKKRQEG